MHKARLKDSGFNIRYYESYAQLDAGIHPQIFICDIMGLDPDSEHAGVHTMKEIRRRFPISTLIGYTALRNTDSRFQEALKYCDQVIRKSDLTDNLINCLDNCIKNINSPKLLWAKIRNYLYEEGYETKEIALFEHFYVKSLERSDPSYLNKHAASCFKGGDLSALLSDIGPAMLKVGFSLVA